jgi:hypothetical protein
MNNSFLLHASSKHGQELWFITCDISSIVVSYEVTHISYNF